MSNRPREGEAPKEPIVVRGLEELHCVGVRIPKDKGDETFCDGKLVKLSPPDTQHPHINEGIYGFTSGVLPGASFCFHSEDNSLTDRGSLSNWDTSPVEKIELMSDGSYRITTRSDGRHAIYILTGTHSHERRTINDLAEGAPAPCIAQRTLRNLWGLLGREKKQ